MRRLVLQKSPSSGRRNLMEREGEEDGGWMEKCIFAPSPKRKVAKSENGANDFQPLLLAFGGLLLLLTLPFCTADSSASQIKRKEKSHF